MSIITDYDISIVVIKREFETSTGFTCIYACFCGSLCHSVALVHVYVGLCLAWKTGQLRQKQQLLEILVFNSQTQHFG